MANLIVGKKHGTGGSGTSGGCIACSLAGAPEGRNRVAAVVGGDSVSGFDKVADLLEDVGV